MTSVRWFLLVALGFTSPLVAACGLHRRSSDQGQARALRAVLAEIGGDTEPLLDPTVVPSAGSEFVDSTALRPGSREALANREAGRRLGLPVGDFLRADWCGTVSGGVGGMLIDPVPDSVLSLARGCAEEFGGRIVLALSEAALVGDHYRFTVFALGNDRFRVWEVDVPPGGGAVVVRLVKSFTADA